MKDIITYIPDLEAFRAEASNVATDEDSVVGDNGTSVIVGQKQVLLPNLTGCSE